MLIIENVTKRYGTFVAVDDISLNIPSGTIHGFLGPNGAGKTTTMKMQMKEGPLGLHWPPLAARPPHRTAAR